MQKCFGCCYYTDKCKNPNSRNYDKFPEMIEKCRPMLIDKTQKIYYSKPKDDSI